MEYYYYINEKTEIDTTRTIARNVFIILYVNFYEINE